MTRVDVEHEPLVDAMRLDALTLKRGRFDAVLIVPDAVRDAGVELLVDGIVVSGAELVRMASGRFQMTAALPEQALCDGVVTVVFRERLTGALLDRYVFRAGAGIDGDVIADLDALTAELEALKRAFMAEAGDRKLRAAERPLIVEETVTAVLRELSGELVRTDTGRIWEE